MSKKIETPGVTGDNINSDSVNRAINVVDSIQTKATNIADEIIINQNVINNPESSDDDKKLAQLKLDALTSTQELINDSLRSAQESLKTIKAQEQVRVVTLRKTDLSDITINKRDPVVVSGPNIELTDAGYIVKSREKGDK